MDELFTPTTRVLNLCSTVMLSLVACHIAKLAVVVFAWTRDCLIAMELFGREAPTNMPMDLIEPIEVVLFGGQQTEVEEASQNYESIEDEGPESKLHAEFYHYSIAFSSETPLKQHCHARRGKYNIQARR